MTGRTQSLQDDLSFMRSLAEGGSPFRSAQFGRIYLACGLIYGAEMIFHWAQFVGWVRLTGTLALVATLSFTAVFVVVVAPMLWVYRRSPATGLANRAIGAAFSGVGLANLSMITVFATVAIRHHNMTIWMLYPAVVFAFQGAAWFLAASLQRRAWMGAVAVGWLAAAICLGLTVDSPAYVAVAGVALLGLMALPGAVLLRQARRAA